MPAVAEALGNNAPSLSISRISLQRVRQSTRKEWVAKLKATFKETDLFAPIIHWDGKLSFFDGEGESRQTCCSSY